MKYLNLIWLFLITIFLSAGYAQRENVIRQQNTLPYLKDTSVIDYFNRLSYLYVQQEKKDSAQYYAMLAYDEAKKINYIHGIAVSFVRKARIVKHFDDDFIKSEKLARESLYWYEKTDNKVGLNDVYYELIYTTHSQSRFYEAIEFSKKKYDLNRKNFDETGMYDALQSIGVIYKDAGNYEESFYYAQQARQFALKENNKYWLQNSLFGLGELYMKIEDYKSALVIYRQAFQMDNPQYVKLRKDGDWDIWVKMEYAEIFSHLNQFDSAWYYYELYKPATKNDRYYRIYLVSTGEYYLLQKKYTAALQNFLQGLYFHKKLNDGNEIQRTLIFIAKTYLALHQYDSAMQFGREALTFANTTKAKQIIRDACQVLYTIYDWHKQSDSANVYFRKYNAMKDSVANDQFKARLAVSTYQQRIDLLDKEKQLQQHQLNETAQQKKFLLSGIVAIFLLVIILFRNILLKRKNEIQSKEKAENELQLQNLESEKIKGVLQQKATALEMQALRAQMNPHFIFNSLNAINLFILQNNKAQASEYLTKFSKLIRLILQNSQSALISLENELDSLKLYLELEALRFDHYFNFTISVEKKLDISVIKLPPLIIQPYAENAIWHGLMHKEEKGHLQIELYEQEKMLYCKITDDGIGRKKSTELKSKSSIYHKSMGMEITANRIAMLQHNEKAETQIKINDLVLADGSAGGTEVLLKIPFCYD